MSEKTFATRKFDELEGLYQGKYMGKLMMTKSQSEWFGDQKFRFYGFDNLNIIGFISGYWITGFIGSGEKRFNLLDMYDCKLIINDEIKSNDSTNDAKDDSKDDSKNKASKDTYIDITNEMKDIGMLLCIKNILATVKSKTVITQSLSADNAKICLGKKGVRYPPKKDIQQMFDEINGIKDTDLHELIKNSAFNAYKTVYDYEALKRIINDYVLIWKDYIKSEFDNNADNLYKKYDIKTLNKVYPWEIIPQINDNYMLYPVMHVSEPDPIRLVNLPHFEFSFNTFRGPYNVYWEPNRIRCLMGGCITNITDWSTLTMIPIVEVYQACQNVHIFICGACVNRFLSQDQRRKYDLNNNSPYIGKDQTGMHNPFPNQKQLSQQFALQHQAHVVSNTPPARPPTMIAPALPMITEHKTSNIPNFNSNTTPIYGNKPRLPGLVTSYPVNI